MVQRSPRGAGPAHGLGGEELFERVEHEAASPYASAELSAPPPAAAANSGQSTAFDRLVGLPPPAVLPPPNAYDKSLRKQEAKQAAEAPVIGRSGADDHIIMRRLIATADDVTEGSCIAKRGVEQRHSESAGAGLL